MSYPRIIGVLLTLCSTALAQQPDMLRGVAFPPELLVRHRDQIGLDDEQITQIRALANEAGFRAQSLAPEYEAATRAMRTLLEAETVDEQLVLKQADVVFMIENKTKANHWRTMVRIRNLLTPKQRAKAAAIEAQQPPGQPGKAKPNPNPNQGQNPNAIRQRLQSKIKRIQAEVQRRANSGRPPNEAMQKMQTFPQLMKLGKVNEADALLDEVMKDLEIGTEGPADTKEDPDSKANANSNGRAIRRARRQQRLDEEQLMARVEGLHEEDVAWKKIAWKTCLLDGLRASRDERKPVMLWVFIDRPIDDERC